MTARSQLLTQYQDCSEHSDWAHRGQGALATALIRPVGARSARRTRSVRTELIPLVEGPAPAPENFAFEVSRRLLEQPWFDDIVATIRELLALGTNWDGSDEQAIHPGAVKRAMHILRTVGEQGPRPNLAPMSDGSVQLEWLYRGQQVRIEVPPDRPALIHVVDPSGRETQLRADNQSKLWNEIKARLTIGTADIKRWAEAATALAQVEDPTRECPNFIATVANCPGAWAVGDSSEAALAELESVLFGWAHLKLRDGDTDIPPMEGIDLVRAP